MNTRVTWFLLLVALGLGGYLFVSERQNRGTVAGTDGAKATFTAVDPATVTAVELLRSNSVVRVERRVDTWAMTLPVKYPAQATAVEAFLEALAKVKPTTWISAAQINVAGGTNSLDAFGLGEGALTVKLEMAGSPVLLKLGGLAPVGDQFYLQRVGAEGVFTAPAAFYGAVPRSADYWRDRGLFDLRGAAYDRLEIRGKTPGFEAQRDASGTWRLTRPLSARADSARIESLINALQTVRVAAFLTDAPNVDLEPLGLQPPENEFILARGTNELVRLQFGNVPADATNFVRVRRPATTNLVLVPITAGQLMRLPLSNFRDRRLLPPLDGLTRVEILAGTNTTTIERGGTNWSVTLPAKFPADPDLVNYWLSQLPTLGIADFPNDVVADFARYGLDRPRREYRFFAGTNLLTHLQFGAADGEDKVFARRLDEPGVYSLPLAALLQQPEAASQFRDFRFASSNVVKVAISQQGRTRALERNAQGEWSVSAGKPATAFTPAVDETLHRLGALQTIRFAVSDETQFTSLPSFQRLAHEFTLTMATNSPVKTVRLRLVADLGGAAVVLLNVDDDPAALRIELPGALAQDVQREFGAQ
jgi:hypothetical protein